MVDVNMGVQVNNIQVNVVLNAVIPSVNQKLVTFTDSDGADAQEWKDVDGFVKARIDSKGNLYLRGSVKKV